LQTDILTPTNEIAIAGLRIVLVNKMDDKIPIIKTK